MSRSKNSGYALRNIRLLLFLFFKTKVTNIILPYEKGYCLLPVIEALKHAQNFIFLLQIIFTNLMEVIKPNKSF